MKIVRTDVDSSRSGFVTATFLFGFDIILEDVEKCRGLSFRLDYDQIDYIHFSEYSIEDFGEHAQAVVVNKLDQLAKKGTLYIGIGTNDDDDFQGIDDPNAIHLEFGVSQSVEHGEELTLDFQNIYAVISTDTGKAIINIEKDPIIYDIHSFVDVWPGDADNNGEVDENDFSIVNFYHGKGSATKNMRSFKRRSASTIWAAHRVLAWDIIEATYADCDGNGDVTTTDLLVVGMHLPDKIEKEGDKPLSDLFNEKRYRRDGTFVIPIYIGSSEKYTGASATVRWDHFPDDIKVLGLERGDIFRGDASFFVCHMNEEQRNADIAFIQTDKTQHAKGEGILAYLIIEGDHAELQPQTERLFGASPYGYIFPLGMITSVNERESNGLSYLQNDNELLISSKSETISSVKIYTSAGALVINHENNITSNDQAFINIGNLHSGAYFALVSTGSGTTTIPFFVVK